ncbi:hypothetical protein [Nonomuraea sp. NPDC005650]|uniref:hypothetical protein n=1 Tax=Nonomuraea sp. NPDC005650 TaxID=3157045 RepID=UPI0033A84E70
MAHRIRETSVPKPAQRLHLDGDAQLNRNQSVSSTCWRSWSYRVAAIRWMVKRTSVVMVISGTGALVIVLTVLLAAYVIAFGAA